MSYHLVHRYGPKDQPKFRKESFPTEPQAVIRAAQYFMAGDQGGFLIEDDAGRIVTNDLEIRQRCKITLNAAASDCLAAGGLIMKMGPEFIGAQVGRA